MSTIDFSCDGEIATLTLSNPGKLNAINLAMWQQLAENMAKISVDRNIRCVVLRGAGTRRRICREAANRCRYGVADPAGQLLIDRSASSHAAAREGNG